MADWIDWIKLGAFIAALPGFLIMLVGLALSLFQGVAVYALALGVAVVLPLSFLVWLVEVIVDLVKSRKRRR